MAGKTAVKTDVKAGRFRQKVLSFMKKNHMTDRGDSVLAAVSGGADSVCLLLLLHEMAAELGIKVFAFHMNHGIRGAEADRDEQFVMELCERLNIPLTVAHEKVEEYAAERGLSGEEAGRILRYHHLGETAEKYQCAKIAVAHHEDDDAETVLLNLFRGSGLAGLSGIRPVRENIIRPLLCVSRKEIEGYLNEQELSWCEDSTNKENDYTRNKIRNELLPWVTENINSRAAEHILAVSEFAAQADAYFEMEAEKILEESCSKRREEGKQPNSKNAGEADGKESGTGQSSKVAENEKKMCTKINTDIFDPQPEILKTYIVRRMILNAAGKAKDITERHIRSVMDLSGPGGGHTVDLPYGLKAVRGYETLGIVQNKNPSQMFGSDQKQERKPVFENKINPETEMDEILDLGGTHIRLHAVHREKELEIPKNQYTKWFDYDKINVGLSIRYRKNGDYLTLSGGGKKKLRRYMIDEKIPENERDRIPVLADGDHVLWVVGYRISDYYKITDETEHILEAEVILPGGESRKAADRQASGIAKEKTMADKIRVLLNEEEVDRRIKEIAEQINKDYEGKAVHLICILKGGVFFTCELAKRLTVPVTLDFMSVSSYGSGTESSGVVKIIKDLDQPLEGKNVLIVEDIIDSGRTLAYLIDILHKRNPNSIHLCTLLDKPERRVKKQVKVDYTCFTIPDEFVVGYGLDYDQKYRNLPFIGVVEQQ